MRHWKIIVPCVWIIASSIGCAGYKLPPSPLPAIGTSLDKVQSHVDSAENAIQVAKPHADKQGQTAIDIASTEHKSAQKEVGNAKQELTAAEKDRANLTARNNWLTAANAKLNGSWGHKLQVFVQAFLTLILILLAVHFVVGLVAVFLPPPYATIARFAAGIVNPAAWFQFVVDHLHLRACLNAPVKVIQT